MNDVIEVLGKRITRLEYRDIPVVTLRQIDEAHEKAEGNARKQFNRNKARFVAGEDYFEIPYSEWPGQFDTIKPDAKVGRGGRRGPINVFTERGYGKIVKGWNDDLSWRLHDAMQAAYFHLKERVDLEPPPARHELIAHWSMQDTMKLLADIIGGVLSNVKGYKEQTRKAIDDFNSRFTRLNEMMQSDWKTQDDRVNAAYKRDRMIIEGQRELRALIAEALKAIAQPPAGERPMIWPEWYDVEKIYQEFWADAVIPRRGFLSSAIMKSLQAFCFRTNRNDDIKYLRVGGRWHYRWHIDAVKRWHETEGRYIIENHITLCREHGTNVTNLRPKKNP
jgi:hypothetical protein